MCFKLLHTLFCGLLCLGMSTFATAEQKDAYSNLSDSDLEHLESQVLQQAHDLNPEVLKLGLTAYEHASQEGLVKKPVITLIDYSLPSSEKRFWVIDLAHQSVLVQTYVAHGKISGEQFAHYFSNRATSLASSLGVFVTGTTYYGKHGYSLRLHGMENGVNDSAFKRAIVIHPAYYVSEAFLKEHGRLGRSWGCPALDQKVSSTVINDIKDGSLVLAYYPDSHWLSSSSFLKA